MDTATQTGRVRPIWKAGFAGVANGLRGDPSYHHRLPRRTASTPPTRDLQGTKRLLEGLHRRTPSRRRSITTGTTRSWQASPSEPGPRAAPTTASCGSPIPTRSFYPTIRPHDGPHCLARRPVHHEVLRLVDPGQTCILDQYRWTRGTNGSHQPEEVGNYIRSHVARGPDQLVHGLHQRYLLYGAHRL